MKTKFKLTTVALLIAALPAAWAQQMGQPDTAPAVERSGAQQGSTQRSATSQPARTNPLSPIQALPREMRVPAPPEEAGIEWEGFQVFPDINAAATYDTNVYATRNAEVTDWMWSLTPSLVLRREREDYRLDLRMGLDTNRYQSATSQNTDDHWFEGQLVKQISASTNIYGGAGFTRTHEDRGSPNLAFGTRPTIYYDHNAFVGIFHDFGPAYVRVGAVNSNLVYDNVPTSSGAVLNNGDRDRIVTSVGGRVGFRLTKTTDVFVQGTNETRSYQNTPDDASYYRSSKGTRLAAGVAVNFNQRVVGEVYVGQMLQNYDDARLRNVDAAEFGGSLRVHTSPWTTFKLSLDRTLEETVIPGASSYITTTAGARVEHDLAENTLFTGGLSVGQNGFQGVNRTDDVTEASVGVRHYIDSSTYVGASMTAFRRNSDDINAIYSRNQIAFMLGSDFGARRRNRYFSYEDRVGLDLGNGRDGFHGLYFGAMAGAGSLNTRASGLRDLTPGNTDVGDMGNEATSYSFVLGTGQTFDRWYVGVELQAEQPNAMLTHTHSGGTEPLVYSVKQNEGLGLFLRGGYVLDSGSLLYARAGVVSTSFVNTMQNIDGSFTQSTQRQGVRAGVGAEVPVDERMFVRMDYAYTVYDGYDLGTTSYLENYQNKSGMFSVGLGWRFGGGQKKQTVAIDPAFMRGFYAGAQFAHGALNSYLNSPTHYHASGSDTLQADFGSMEVSGSVYVGWGHTFNRVYLGVEGEVDPSLTRWAHDRTTSGGGGRDFSVNKKGGYGLDMRAGYVLENGAMLYARVGGLRSKFNTLYQRGNSPLVDREDTLYGSRVGLGAELPINRAAYWRLDFTLTDYGSAPYFSAGGSGNPDVLNFAMKESLFRLGLGVRF